MILRFTYLTRPTRVLTLLAGLAALAGPGRALAQTLPTSRSVPAAALPALTALGRAQGLKATDLADPLVTDSYYNATMGLTHTYFQQRVNGLTVCNATGAVHTDKAGKAVASNQRFVTDVVAKAPAPTPTLSPEQAVAAASAILGLPRPVGLRRTVEARVADGLLFNNAGISEYEIPVRLVYARQGDKLVLAWSVTIAQLDQQHHYAVRLDAQTGRLVDRDDYVVEERASFAPQAFEAQARRRARLPAATLATTAAQLALTATQRQPAARATTATTTTTARTPVTMTAAAATPLGAARSLTVTAMPGENPIVSPRVSIPLPGATPWSPYGWQVGQGLAQNDFFADSYSLASSGRQLTRGNNVAAYDDNSTKTNATSLNLGLATASPDGGANLDFDFPLDRTKSPRDPANLAAGITNLFYWNNVVHDVMQAHGFDEPAGNFQYKNLTGQGAGNDFVRAESQDGSGRNNANFSTPPDGTSGRMQMYLFDNSAANALNVSGSATVAGAYRFATVSFGPRITAKPLAGKLVLVNDGVSDDNGAHGCASPFVNAAAVSGNIAFIQRGGCPQLQLNPKSTNAFATKVKRAQANGATGVIVFDSLATTNLVNFGGTDTVGIRIPAIFISGADGFRLRAAITGGATLSVAAELGPDIDGSFDSGVISHEYGHGISNRLTGGPSVVDCLSNASGNQLGGEGWSDFFALWMTTKPGDDGSTNRYVGTYDVGQPINIGPGFRRKPYSTQFSATGNNYTYAQLGTGTSLYKETHDVGEVWCTVLWDLNWQLIYRYGYNPDFYAATGGNNIALKLVLDGCKLQPCNPSFLDARDAILQADAVSNGGANTALIWNVFARRGMGFGALPGDLSTAGVPQVTGVVQGFDLPPGIQTVVLANRNGVATASTLEAYPNPAQNELLVRAPISSSGPVRVVLFNLLGQQVLQASGAAATLQQSGVPLDTRHLANGTYLVRVTTSSGVFSTRVTIQR